MSNKIQIKFEGAFKITHLHEGGYTFFLPLNDNVARLIGQIIVYWGAFELRMDKMIEVAHTSLGTPASDGWKTLPFKKRKTLFRDIMRTYSSRVCPQEKVIFDQIVTKSGDLHWRRNVVAHGYYNMGWHETPDEDGLYKSLYTANGTVKGTTRSIRIDEDTLEKLWHDIAHLTGDLLAAINRIGGTAGDGRELVIADRDLLQGPQSGSFHLLAMAGNT